MRPSYAGPVRSEPPAVELHNTLYALRGELMDGLDTGDGLSRWLAAISDRLPAPGRDVDESRRPEFLALRNAVREALHAVVEGRPVPAAALAEINAAAARAPSWRVATRGRGRLRGETRYGTDDGTDVALAALAADAIELLTGPDRERLRLCGAPGCVLALVKDHPRRTWCSDACGNRARQARHYERTRRSVS